MERRENREEIVRHGLISSRCGIWPLEMIGIFKRPIHDVIETGIVSPLIMILRVTKNPKNQRLVRVPGISDKERKD